MIVVFSDIVSITLKPTVQLVCICHTGIIFLTGYKICLVTHIFKQ